MIFVARFMKFLTSLLVAVLVAGLGLAATYASKWSRDLPDYRELDGMTRNLGAETKVFARDGSYIGNLIPKIGDQAVSRTIVNLEEISPFMLATLISNEDRRFFEHYGLDPYGLARQFQKLAKGQEVQGGSTLTNQLVKNTLLFDEYRQARTPDRKVKEWMLSTQVERSFTKEEILQAYLNSTYWGDGGPVELYGVYAAAQAYFSTTPKKLTLAQAAYLTALIPTPKYRYSQYKEQTRPAMKAMFARMVEDGWITQKQAETAWREKIQPNGWQIKYDDNGNVLSAALKNPKAKEIKAVNVSRYPHFMGQVESELVRRFGRQKVYQSGGLRVYTTIDPKVQNAVETASREAFYGRNAVVQGLPFGATLAAVIIDPYNAEVLGMIGQKIQDGQSVPEWNNAAQGQRQVGSTIKPLLYTTALERGASQMSREQDAAIRIWDAGARRYYEPKNYEGHGRESNRYMTLREALDKSLNLVTIRVAQSVGLDNFFKKLTDLGLPPNDGTGLAAAIGAVETTPVKLAAAYAPFVNGGLYRPPRYISRVTTARGEVLFDASTDQALPKRVWTPQVAWLGLDMIRGVVNDLNDQQGGLASRAKLANWPVAGKTGTTNGITTGSKDLWFAGTTPLYTGVIWVGKQQSGEMPGTYYSGWVAPPIWKRMMQIAHAGKTPTNFNEPPGIYYVNAPDQGFLPGVKLAMTDKRYLAVSVQPEISDSEIPRAIVYNETTFDPDVSDPRTLVIEIDKTTGQLATEFTLPQNIVQRRVYIEDLPGYAPPQNPKPLRDEPPSPEALKLVRSQAEAEESTVPATKQQP